jgi:hypothetical protein
LLRKLLGEEKMRGKYVREKRRTNLETYLRRRRSWQDL